MRPTLLALAGWLALTQAARADDGLPADTLGALKDATVFIKIDAGRVGGMGSGFLVHGDGETGYVVTNHHVVSTDDAPSAMPRPRIGPPIPRPPFAGPGLPGAAAPATVTLVFHSGTRREFSAKAEVLGSDKQLDLALLKVTGVKDLPKPLDVAAPAELRETMAVYVLGFPLGDALAVGRKNPAVTVGRAAVSSIRTDERDEVTQVQVDGDLIPGNSGGPLVDAKGRLVGVAKARITNTRIGQAVPAGKVGAFLAGRPGEPRLTFGKKGDKNTVEVKVELSLVDPFAKVRKAGLVYLLGDGPMAAVKAADDVATKWGAKELELTVKDGKAVGTFTAEASEDGKLALSVQGFTADDKGKRSLSTARSVRFGDAAAAPVARKPLAGAELTKAVAELTGDHFAVMRAAGRLAAAAPDPARREEVAKALEAIVTDEKAHVVARSSAAKALGVWGDTGAVKKLEPLFDGREFPLRQAALEALGQIGGADAAVAAAKRLSDDRDWSYAARALIAMGPAAEKPAAKVLAESAGGEIASWRARAEACKVLKAVGTKESLPALGKAAEDGNGIVQLAAREAIKAIEEREAKPKK